MSDTHGKWDERYLKYFEECDYILHAGDIGDYTILERLSSECTKVIGVSGNIDSGMVRRKCKELEIFNIEGIKVLLTHIGGYPGKWAPGMKKLLKENGIKLMIDGHSHILKIKFDPELDLLHINPGAAGEQGWHKVRTLVRLSIDGEEMKDCEVIELNRRM